MRVCHVLPYPALLALIALAQVAVVAQTQNIQARVSGGGGNGKCTFEVQVDGSAEVQIRGNTGQLRTLSGRPATWRRLNCNQVLPRNPYNFRFAGIDGRGRQTLVRAPGSNNGVAVVRIDDNRNGMQGYTGDIMWSGGDNGGNRPGPGGGPGWNSGAVNPRVVPNCQNAIRNKLVSQNGGSLNFNGSPNTRPAGSSIMVQGQATYRDARGQVGTIQYNCTMHPNGNVADSSFNRIGNTFPAPQPR
jgi:hypothetical protein